MIFNLDFANCTILSYVFFFFLIIDLYILIPAVITEHVIPIRITNEKLKAEMEAHPVIVEITISKWSI